MDRKIYLTNTDLTEAVDEYLLRLDPSMKLVKTEDVDVREALGRVTADPVIAKISSPNHNAAAMDGIMVITDRTYAASEPNPVILRKGEDYVPVNTGNLIKDPYDGVIMIEDIVDMSPEQIKIFAPATPWQHVRPIGEDIVAGEMILPEHHRIRPMDIGALLSGGTTKIKVYEKIRVGIIPTGNEISDHYDELEKGMIYDTNSWTFCSIVSEMGGEFSRVSPVADNFDLLTSALAEMVEKNHVVILNAGSSAGSKDYTSEVIRQLGEVVLHGIAIRPGKPTILGFVKNRPVIGVPGYPGSAYLVFEEVVGPVIRKLQRIQSKEAPAVEAVLSRRIVSSLKYREYIRVKLGKVGETLIATPLNRGAGVTMSLVRSDGLLIVPKNSEGYDAGARVPVKIATDMKVIENTIVCIGSHDLILDYIGSLLIRNQEGSLATPVYLSSAHVGSMGGIMALKRGEAHLAPIHLLDEETGTYNESYLQKYLSQEDVVLIKGVKREQGFMVPAGNPKKIRSIEDLDKSDILFVNRQKGSGTRILTDYLTKKAGIETDKIKGYQREMTTHMAVAAAVESGSADVGIGIASAAKTMGLDFISIGFEEYDFAIPRRFLETEMIRQFIKVLHSEEFSSVLQELGGYGL